MAVHVFHDEAPIAVCVPFAAERLVLVRFLIGWFAALSCLGNHASRCLHCQKLEPEYAKAAKDLQQDGLLLGKVRTSATKP